MGKKKGKGKKAEVGSGEELSQAGSSGAEPQLQEQKPTSSEGLRQPQVTQVESPLSTSPPPQLPPQEGQKKGKKKNKQQQPTATPVVEHEQPAPQKLQSQPADVQATQPASEGKGKRKGKKQEIQEPPGPPSRQRPAAAPEPVPVVSQQPQGAGGRNKGQTSLPQEQPGDRGQTPPPLQQPRGRGQTPPPLQQPRGRGQTPPPQQQPGGRGHTPPPQQQPGGRGHTSPQQQQPGGRGHTPPQQQQPGGRGHTPPQQQQQPGGRGHTPPQQQQPGGRGHTPPQQQPGGRVHTPPQQQPAGRGRGAPEPVPVVGQQPQGAWGRNKGQPSPPQQQPGGSGQTPPLQQPGGRGQTPPQQQQQQGAWGRNQTQPSQQGPWGAKGQGRGAGRGQAAGPVSQQPPGGEPVYPSKQQSVEKSLEQLRIGDQPSKQQSQASAAPPVRQAPKSFDLAIPRRKDLRKGGTQGIPFTVETNHLALDINPRFEIAVHYDVAITPDKPKRMMRQVWEEFKRLYLPRFAIAFDDVRNAYAPTRLKDDVAGEVQVAEDPYANPRTYKVVVKYAAEVNLRALFTYMQSGGRTAVPQEALQCIDIVLRNASALRFVRVGRSYFSQPHGQIVSLGDGLELWHGFFQSAVIGWKPFLNVDVAHKGFPKAQPVIGLFADMISQPRDRGDSRSLSLNDDDIEKISKFMKGLKIQYEIRGQPATRKCYRTNSLALPPDRAIFVHNDNKISVLDYFRKEKNYNIAHPQLPCLWVGPRDRKIYLPAELCTILPGQVCNRKLNEIQTSQMVRNAATNTTVRKDKIINAVRNVGFNNDDVVQAFGLRIGTDFEKVKARLLQPPALQYGVQRPVMPSRGVWRADKFLIPQVLPQNSWTIINLDRRTRDDNLSNFARMLQQNSVQLGMTIGQPEQPFIRMDQRFDVRQFEETLRKLKSSKKMIFVVVPEFPTNIYGKVKHTAEVKVGCLTQCIKSKTIFKMNPATVGNILLKVNAKLNGHNHTIAENCRPKCLEKPCMIMGADVTHPSPDQTDIPSVAAVTASCDPRAFQYTFSWRLQDPRQEIITDLERIVRDQLMFYYKQSRQQPQRIIFFRDGVSEGQFQEVMNMEVQAIRRACSSLGNGSYKPPITFLVVQKRHHTRFFPTNPRETDDRNSNVRAGTVVDTEITHPTDLEYYLVSHASIQGVARPTKYRVLWDDTNMSEDDLEELTYYLCHMFSRCTRSVSYPAPTYYAHLAAFRARVYLEGHRVNLDNLLQEQENLKIRDEIIHGLPMFFV